MGGKNKRSGSKALLPEVGFDFFKRGSQRVFDCLGG